MRSLWPGALAALALALLPAVAMAHALLLSVQSDGQAIVGTVYYSDGALAVGEFLMLQDPEAPQAPARETRTDESGKFRFDSVVAGKRYRVVAEGEEGHITEMDIVHGEGARATLNDADSATEEGGVPAWLVLGGALLLSAVPALWLRLRKPAEPA